MSLRLRWLATSLPKIVADWTSLSTAASIMAGSANTHVIEWAGGPVTANRNGSAEPQRGRGWTTSVWTLLRDRAAVHMTAGGVPMTQIAQMIGHKDSRTAESERARFSLDHLKAVTDVLKFGKFKTVRQVL